MTRQGNALKWHHGFMCELRLPEGTRCTCGIRTNAQEPHNALYPVVPTRIVEAEEASLADAAV